MKRLPFVDAYKAFLIALVVLGHSFQHVVSDFDGNFCVKMIYSHHMAAFFFLSGFVAWRPELAISALPKRVLRLIVPFFAWWFILWLVHDRAHLLRSLQAILRTPDAGYWFLWVLAACQFLLLTLSDLARRFRLNGDGVLAGGLLVLLVVELLTGYSHYGFHFLAWYSIFFLGGYWVRKAQQAFPAVHGRIPCAPLAVGLTLVWLMLLPGWSRNATIAVPLVGVLPGPLAFGYRLITAGITIALGLALFSRMKGPAPRLVSCIGQSTLGIYILHGFLLDSLAPAISGWPEPLRILALFALTLPIATALTLLIRRIPCVGRWLA